jgi:hypothetical protein
LLNDLSPWRTDVSRPAEVPEQRRRLVGRPEKAAARMLDLACARAGWPRPVALVTGFWRSGTTWLQETLAAALAAKTVFEPLSPRIPAYAELIKPLPLPSYAAREAFMPCLDVRPGQVDWRYLDDAFRGYCSGHFALLCRTRVRESLRRRVVVKCVRLQLSQTAVHRRYGVPIVHLRRHPCAVAASFKLARWAWDFEQARLADILLGVEDGRAVLLGPALAEMVQRFDTDPVSRVAAYWALTEHYVQASLGGQPWARLLCYEEAVAAPEAVLADLGSFLGQPLRTSVQAGGDSPVTEATSRGLSGQARAQAWRHRLAPSEIDRILHIVAVIFPQAGVEP